MQRIAVIDLGKVGTLVTILLKETFTVTGVDGQVNGQSMESAAFTIRTT